MWFWFKQKKIESDLSVKESSQMTFTQEESASIKDTSMPLVHDYPKSKYKVYWEVINGFSPKEGYSAKLRLNSYQGGIVEESVLTNRSSTDLKKQLAVAIKQKMEKHKVGMG